MKGLIFLTVLSFLCVFCFSQEAAYARVKVYADVDQPVILAGSEENGGLFPYPLGVLEANASGGSG